MNLREVLDDVMAEVAAVEGTENFGGISQKPGDTVIGEMPDELKRVAILRQKYGRAALKLQVKAMMFGEDGLSPEEKAAAPKIVARANLYNDLFWAALRSAVPGGFDIITIGFRDNGAIVIPAKDVPEDNDAEECDCPDCQQEREDREQQLPLFRQKVN